MKKFIITTLITLFILSIPTTYIIYIITDNVDYLWYYVGIIVIGTIIAAFKLAEMIYKEFF